MSDSYVVGLETLVASTDIIKPWLLLGPFYEDVSASVRGLSLFERPGSVVGQDLLAQLGDDADSLLHSTPREGDQATFRGQPSRWELARRPEKFLSWGQYNVVNHLGAAFLSTVVVPDAPGEKHWRLVTRISSRVIIVIGGQIVLDTAGHDGERTRDGYEHHFTATLDDGENPVTVGMFRIGRMAQIGLRLELLDAEVTARVRLAEGVPASVRVGVERTLAGLSLGRDLFHPDDKVRLMVGVEPDPETALRVQLVVASTGQTVREVDVVSAGPLTLCQGTDLADGDYRIECAWSRRDGQYLTSSSFEILKVSSIPAPQGVENADERARLLLAGVSDCDNENFREAIWIQVSRYALGRYQEVDVGIVRQTCEFIADRQDCADFSIQAVLRLMYWEREERRLSPEINALMKDTVLGFKYWVDEPGDMVMYMGSENHRLLFHVSEWMAGQLFGTEEFTNTGQRGLFHAARGRTYIVEWLRQRGRFGFDEWHSNSYLPVCLAPLANVYDFTIAEESKLRDLTRSVLDYMSFILAADTYQGVFGTTHGRSYGRYLKHPELETTAPVCWLWYGTGSLAPGAARELMGPVSLASGDYRPELIMSAIATDHTSVIESRHRQGLLAGSERSANFCVFRTPDYLISGLQDHRKGEYESSTHVAQVTLGNQAVIFWSCPLTSGEGSGLRPDYWSGHAALPRVVQYRNVMSLTWRASEYAWMTHCYFEQERFDEVTFRDGSWAFARSGSGYVAIHSQHGLAIGDHGQYAGRELICPAVENTWLVECGRESDWGSLSAFVEAVSSSSPVTSDDTLTYVSPSIGTFVTGWDVTPTVEGAPVPLDDYPMTQSPWAHAGFGSGELTIRHGDRTHQLWFNQ